MATSIADLVAEAESGNLSLKADPAAFVALEKAMTVRMQQLLLIQQKIRAVADQEIWGLGESSAVLTSAQTLVRRFREKADNGPNNAVATLETHIVAARELGTLFRTIRQRYEEADADFAAKFKESAAAQGLNVGGNR
ncbi:hypothetical protein [Nocardia fluminea]|uniref:PE family protein n=1 Tax=Nocardia fluminea TaxID=134984 RepID=A0A2N3V591_9NOCA|nr:hypothetical protein [Nocardia fluminea]PKV76793.1 hypothetical protein ATK86_7196 [Nocardia fluminea]